MLSTGNRRRFERLARPLEGSFRGRSGASPARITDIGWGGCFVETVAAPMVGEETAVLVTLDSGPLELPGRVLYVEPAMGFGVVFLELDEEQIDGLTQLLGAPPGVVKSSSTAPLSS